MAILLVTGGAGIIGPHLLEELLKNGHKVVAIDDLSGGCPANGNSGSTFVQGAILDAEITKNLPSGWA